MGSGPLLEGTQEIVPPLSSLLLLAQGHAGNTALICLATPTTCCVVTVIPAVPYALNVLISPKLPCPTRCASSHFLGYLSKQQWVRHKRLSPVSIYIFIKSN